MNQSATVAAVPENVAELLEQLGDIPATRVRLRPYPGTATEADVIALHDRFNRLFELVDGVLVEKAMGYYEGRLAAVLVYFLETFLDRNPLGVVAAPDGMMRLAAGLVRMPDVSFVPWDRFPNRHVPREPIPDLYPELAVEVLSASNTPREMERKLREYFKAGTRLVWYIDPRDRTVRVHTSPEQSTVLDESGTLDGGSVLPGFALQVRELFARAG